MKTETIDVDKSDLEHYASYHEKTWIIGILVNHGADFNRCDQVFSVQDFGWRNYLLDLRLEVIKDIAKRCTRVLYLNDTKKKAIGEWYEPTITYLKEYPEKVRLVFQYWDK